MQSYLVWRGTAFQWEAGDAGGARASNTQSGGRSRCRSDDNL